MCDLETHNVIPNAMRLVTKSESKSSATMNRKPTIVTTSWDDGHPLDLKLADLLSNFNIKGTFYIAPHNTQRETIAPQQLKQLNQGFEIGAHTRYHVRLPGLTKQQLVDEIHGGKQELEELVGQSVFMFSYPWGKHNLQIRHMVRTAGFIGARTTQKFCLDVGKNLWQMPTTFQAYPHSNWLHLRHLIWTHNLKGLTLLEMRKMPNWIELAKSLFETVLEKGGVWHLWGHSWEIEEQNLWQDLYEIFSAVAGHKNVAYLTNSEVIHASVTGS